MAVAWREDLTTYTTSELKSKIIEDDSPADLVLYTFMYVPKAVYPAFIDTTLIFIKLVMWLAFNVLQLNRA